MPPIIDKYLPVLHCQQPLPATIERGSKTIIGPDYTQNTPTHTFMYTCTEIIYFDCAHPTNSSNVTIESVRPVSVITSVAILSHNSSATLSFPNTDAKLC